MSTNKIYRRKRVNFLKIYPLIREVQSLKYSIKKKDFDVLMYCDDLVYFRERDFDEGIYWGGWDPKRFKRLTLQEYLEKLPGTGTGKGNPTKYKLTLKARQMVTNTYKMCYHEKEIPESKSMNPIMKGGTYSHKKMAKFIIKHNQQLRDEQRKKFTSR